MFGIAHLSSSWRWGRCRDRPGRHHRALCLLRCRVGAGCGARSGSWPAPLGELMTAVVYRPPQRPFDEPKPDHRGTQRDEQSHREVDPRSDERPADRRDERPDERPDQDAHKGPLVTQLPPEPPRGKQPERLRARHQSTLDASRWQAGIVCGHRLTFRPSGLAGLRLLLARLLDCVHAQE